MKLKSDGKFQALTGLGDNTVIRSVQVLELQDGNDSNDFLEDNQVLLVMGSLNLPNFGNVSAATFNGTDWKPLFLTTTTGNRPGTIASLFSQRQQKFSPGGKKTSERLRNPDLPCHRPGPCLLARLLGCVGIIHSPPP
jgi:hypothetical protein